MSDTADTENTMTTFQATMIAEGVQEAESKTQYLEAWAHLIKTGTCWSLQGWFGRNASSFIQNEVISKEGEVLIDPETYGDDD